jgi:hypothetical protein
MRSDGIDDRQTPFLIWATESEASCCAAGA